MTIALEQLGQLLDRTPPGCNGTPLLSVYDQMLPALQKALTFPNGPPDTRDLPVYKCDLRGIDAREPGTLRAVPSDDVDSALQFGVEGGQPRLQRDHFGRDAGSIAALAQT
jgi:hypothetical protein